MDKDMNIIRSRLPFLLEPGQMNFSIMQPNVLSSSPKSVLFNEFHADTLYMANTDTVKPAHFLDFGRYTFPSSGNGEFSSAKEKIQHFVKNSKEYIVGANNVVETSQEFSFVFIYDNFPYIYYWNKKNNKALVIKEIQYGKKSNILPPPITYTNLSYIGIITWERLQNLSLGQLEKGTPMFEAVSIAKEKYKNPVLVLYNYNL